MATLLSAPFAAYALFTEWEQSSPHVRTATIEATSIDGDTLVIVALAAFVAMAFFGVIDQLLTDRAYRLLPNTGIIGPFMYTSVVFSVLFDGLFLGRLPGLSLLAGAGLVVAGATLAVASTDRSDRTR